MTKQKGVYTGIIEQDEEGNFFCGEYLLDYKYTASKFKLGDEVNLKSVITNPSDKSYDKYPKKSGDFFLANDKPAPDEKYKKQAGKGKNDRESE